MYSNKYTYVSKGTTSYRRWCQGWEFGALYWNSTLASPLGHLFAKDAIQRVLSHITCILLLNCFKKATK